MKKLILSLSIVFALGMVSCGGGDKSDQQAEWQEAENAGYAEDENGNIIAPNTDSDANAPEDASPSSIELNKQAEAKALEQLDQQIDAEMDAVERDINNAMMDALPEED